MAESGCKCKSLSIHRPDTSGYLMYHTSNLCIIHQILCIGTISSDTSCIIHQILDVYLHLHPDEHLALNFAIHILYSDTAYTAIHGDTAYRMYHPPSEFFLVRTLFQNRIVSYRIYKAPKATPWDHDRPAQGTAAHQCKVFACMTARHADWVDPDSRADS